MKKIAAIGLLVLLLYNTLGLTFAIFFFEENFKVVSPVSQNDDWKLIKVYLPSLPYSGTWENTDQIEGLLQEDGSFYNATHLVHKNDTLYITLKSNQVARDQFFELAGMMEMITDNNKEFPESAQNKALKILNDLVKNYIPSSQIFQLINYDTESSIACVYQLLARSTYASYEVHLNTPPPEIS